MREAAGNDNAQLQGLVYIYAGWTGVVYSSMYSVVGVQSVSPKGSLASEIKL